MKRTCFEANDCPVARVLDAIGDWWSLLIIRDAFQGQSKESCFPGRKQDHVLVDPNKGQLVRPLELGEGRPMGLEDVQIVESRMKGMASASSMR